MIPLHHATPVAIIWHSARTRNANSCFAPLASQEARQPLLGSRAIERLAEKWQSLPTRGRKTGCATGGGAGKELWSLGRCREDWFAVVRTKAGLLFVRQLVPIDDHRTKHPPQSMSTYNITRAKHNATHWLHPSLFMFSIGIPLSPQMFHCFPLHGNPKLLCCSARDMYELFALRQEPLQ